MAPKDKEDNPNKGKDNNSSDKNKKDKKDKKDKNDGNSTQRSEGGGGDGKGECGECGAKQNAFNHCVHCANKICDNCRKKHVEQLLGDFMGSRQEAASCERHIYKSSVKGIEDALLNIKISHNIGEQRIHESFKAIDKLLIARKAVLLKELHNEHEKMKKQILKEKTPVETLLVRASDKFKDACKISITPVTGAVAASFNKLGDGEFARICVSTTTAKESIAEFDDIKSQMESIAEPGKVTYEFEDSFEQIADFIAEFGEIVFVEGGGEDDDKNNGKGRGRGRGKDKDNDSKGPGKDNESRGKGGKDKDNESKGKGGKGGKDKDNDNDGGKGRGRGHGRGHKN